MAKPCWYSAKEKKKEKKYSLVWSRKVKEREKRKRKIFVGLHQKKKKKVEKKERKKQRKTFFGLYFLSFLWCSHSTHSKILDGKCVFFVIYIYFFFFIFFSFRFSPFFMDCLRTPFSQNIYVFVPVGEFPKLNSHFSLNSFFFLLFSISYYKHTDELDNIFILYY